MGLTTLITKPIQHHVENHWAKSGDCLKREVLARGAHLALIPISAVTSALDTIAGAVAGLGSIVTVGRHSDTYMFHRTQMDNSRKIIARPFVNFVKFINPAAKFSGDENSVRRHNFDDFDDMMDFEVRKPPKISGDGNGFITNVVRTIMDRKAHKFTFSSSGFKRQVLSRLTFALMAPASVVTRAADAAIGLVAGFFSVLSAGNFESLNNLAYRGLQTPGIISDLFYSTIKFLNPRAGLV